MPAKERARDPRSGIWLHAACTAGGQRDCGVERRRGLFHHLAAAGVCRACAVACWLHRRGGGHSAGPEPLSRPLCVYADQRRCPGANGRAHPPARHWHRHGAHVRLGAGRAVSQSLHRQRAVGDEHSVRQYCGHYRGAGGFVVAGVCGRSGGAGLAVSPAVLRQFQPRRRSGARGKYPPARPAVHLAGGGHGGDCRAGDRSLADFRFAHRPRGHGADREPQHRGRRRPVDGARAGGDLGRAGGGVLHRLSGQHLDCLAELWPVFARPRLARLAGRFGLR